MARAATAGRSATAAVLTPLCRMCVACWHQAEKSAGQSAQAGAL